MDMSMDNKNTDLKTGGKFEDEEIYLKIPSISKAGKDLLIDGTNGE